MKTMKVPEGFHTRTEAAELIGISRETLKRWHNTGVFVSTHTMRMGNLSAWLYSDEDIAYLQKYVSEGRASRKRIRT